MSDSQTNPAPFPPGWRSISRSGQWSRWTAGLRQSNWSWRRWGAVAGSVAVSTVCEGGWKRHGEAESRNSPGEGTFPSCRPHNCDNFGWLRRLHVRSYVALGSSRTYFWRRLLTRPECVFPRVFATLCCEGTWSQR